MARSFEHPTDAFCPAKQSNKLKEEIFCIIICHIEVSPNIIEFSVIYALVSWHIASIMMPLNKKMAIVYYFTQTTIRLRVDVKQQLFCLCPHTKKTPHALARKHTKLQ
jgi:hypothetical protein